jgi:hypothetical protein
MFDHWQNDGKQFVAGYEISLNCYQDFFESEDLKEVEKEAINKSEKDKIRTIVFDRRIGNIVFRANTVDQTIQEDIPAKNSSMVRTKKISRK